MSLPKIFDQVFPRGRLSAKHVFALFSFIFVVWAFYRFFPEILPAWVDELILKPLFWVLPTFWLVRRVEKEKLSSLGFTMKNFWPSLYWGIGLGVVLALEGLLTNIFKYRGLNLVNLNYSAWDFLGVVVLSFVTAFSEETVFRGYIFSRLSRLWKSEWLASVVSAFLFALIYLPVAIFVLSYRPAVMLVYLFFVFVYGFASTFVFARTGNIISSILLHVFWSWPIILFR